VAVDSRKLSDALVASGDIVMGYRAGRRNRGLRAGTGKIV
jgi:hypothetical protein